MAGRTLSKLAGLAGRAARAPAKAGGKAGSRIAARAQETGGPSPNPKTNLILADIALRGGGLLLRRGIERGLLGMKYSPDKAKNIVKGRKLTETLAGAALARFATTSVPGAIVVGGGLLAKTLYDRRRNRVDAKVEGEAALADMADDGKDK